MIGNIHSLETFGTVDGPGIRYVVFMQGCPMRCAYCHNPDSWDVNVGEKMSVDDLVKDIAKYTRYIDGITVSGGEPLLQIDFLIDLFKKVRELGLTTCIDTSGIVFNKDNLQLIDKLNTLMNVTDIIMLDIKHIDDNKDFTPIIEKALELGGYKEKQKLTGINGGNILTVGFGHNTVLSVADKVIDAIKTGALKHIFLVGGCDGAKNGRNYYTDFVNQTPKDTLVLTLACGKYRFNDLDLGEINGIPRLLDMGQCNDAYSAIKVAVELSKIFNCSVNDLPLSLVLSWYEQKAICILLTLLYLGIENIRLGPTLPAFISPNILNILVEKFKIKPITITKSDLNAILD